jgi:hypothetical protein
MLLLCNFEIWCLKTLILSELLKMKNSVVINITYHLYCVPTRVRFKVLWEYLPVFGKDVICII